MTFAREQAPAKKPAAAVARAPGGQRLPAPTQERMSRALGHDFGAVRIHAGPAGADRADELGARAAAVGGDLFFARGEYRPGTPEGDRLLGHELAHVVQQGGGEPTPGPRDPERAADEAGDAVASGRRATVGQPAMPAGVPALQPQKPWKDRVEDAKKETDLAKRATAMTALAQEALGTAYTVKQAGNTSPDKVDEKDYAFQPTINFDVRLNQKNRKDGTAVGDNAGYTFGSTTDTSKRIVILGPNALKSIGDVALYADHELYHARNPNAGELEAWTDSFVNHFLKTFGNSWYPLIGYYEGEKAAKDGTFPQRVATINALDTYYRGLSDTASAGQKNSDKRKFILWFRRRLGDKSTTMFVKDLSAKTGITDTEPPDKP